MRGLRIELTELLLLIEVLVADVLWPAIVKYYAQLVISLNFL